MERIIKMINASLMDTLLKSVLPTPPKDAPIDYPRAAGSHAKAARLFLADAEPLLLDVAEGATLPPEDQDRADLLVQAAQAHALTAQAFILMNPPARRKTHPPRFPFRATAARCLNRHGDDPHADGDDALEVDDGDHD